MKKLSLNNGLSFVDIEDLTEKEIGKIDKYWDELVVFMDAEDMEEANNFTDADTDTLSSRIEYLKDYLSVAKDNLILG